MRRNRSVLIALAVIAAAALVATVASADDGGPKGADHGKDRHDDAAKIFSAALAPSLVADPSVHGVAPGGAPWVLDRGRVQLAADGRIRIEVRGLVIPVAHGTFPANTALPVTTVNASLYCAPDSSGAAATTVSVPISPDGNARITGRVSLPATCLAPTVLVHPNGGLGAYIALPGWRS